VRALVLLLLLAAGFGLAALWQSRHLERLREEREAAAQVVEGELGRTESGLVPAGLAVVTVGKPSGAAPLEGAREADPPEVVEAPEAEPFEHPPLPDFEMVVAEGQSLSKIAAAHYGEATRALVDALARYNGLDDANLLKAGDTLFLPALETLTGE
jgi:nucleoid-associated protein YgaU